MFTTGSLPNPYLKVRGLEQGAWGLGCVPDQVQSSYQQDNRLKRKSTFRSIKLISLGRYFLWFCSFHRAFLRFRTGPEVPTPLFK